jgi:hypothetical protein
MPLPQETTQMTDTTQNTVTDDNGDSKRRIATREWINADGEKVSTGSPDVAGVRYTYLKTGGQVEYVYGENGQLDRQFAAMGAVTKLGNIVNTITNDDAYDGRDPIPEVVEWLKDATAGKWREAAEGLARGPKYDKDILAAVLVALFGDKAAGDVLHYRQKLDDKSYYGKVRANTKVMAAYAIEQGKRGGDEVSADALI